MAFHLVSEGSWSLFHGAIAESNPAASAYPDLAGSIARGNIFVGETNCTSSACLYALSADDIIAAQVNANNIINRNARANSFMIWVPTVDGVVLTGQLVELFAQGHFNPVPVMIGDNGNEGRMFVCPSAISFLTH